MRILLGGKAAARLQRDWFYCHSRFEPQADGRVVMCYGEGDRELVFALLRWLGPEAELLEPAAWRAPFADSLQGMAAGYSQ